MSTRSKRVFLIYRASTDSMRVVTKRPKLYWDEVAFTVDVKIPDPWGRLAGAILIELPETGPAVIEIEHTEETS